MGHLMKQGNQKAVGIEVVIDGDNRRLRMCTTPKITQLRPAPGCNGQAYPPSAEPLHNRCCTTPWQVAFKCVFKWSTFPHYSKDYGCGWYRNSDNRNRCSVLHAYICFAYMQEWSRRKSEKLIIKQKAGVFFFLQTYLGVHLVLQK